jgi:hypothetical protein
MGAEFGGLEALGGLLGGKGGGGGKGEIFPGAKPVEVAKLVIGVCERAGVADMEGLANILLGSAYFQPQAAPTPPKETLVQQKDRLWRAFRKAEADKKGCMLRLWEAERIKAEQEAKMEKLLEEVGEVQRKWVEAKEEMDAVFGPDYGWEPRGQEGGVHRGWGQVRNGGW